MNSSKLYEYEAPIDLLPESARDAALRWVIGNAYYRIEFTVAEGPPHLAMDLVIPGRKGGTHRTRWQERTS